MSGREESQEDRRRALALEAALLALLLRRRRAARTESQLRMAIATGILNGRQAARVLGRRSLAAAFSVSSAASPMTRLADASRAYDVALSHVAQVRRAQAQAILDGATNPARRALLDTEFRVRTIAASETFSAASEERLTAAREVQQDTGLVIEKEWNAEGDACPVCRGLDGTTVGVDEDFPGGAEPGAAHPNCRCWLELHAIARRKVA